MNCFSISVYVSNYTPRGNYAVFGVYITPAPVIAVLYYMLIFFHQQHLLVDGAVSSVLLQMSSSFDYVGYDLLLTHLLRSPQSSRLLQPSSTSASVVCPSVSVVLLGCWLGVDSLLRLVWTRHLVTSLGVDSRCYFARCGLSVWIRHLVLLRFFYVSTISHFCFSRVSFGLCSSARLLARSGLITSLGVDSLLGNFARCGLLVWTRHLVLSRFSTTYISLLLGCSLALIAAQLDSVLVLVFTASCVVVWLSGVPVRSRSRVAAQLDSILLSTHSVVCRCLVVSCLVLVSVFTASCVVVRSSRVSVRLFSLLCRGSARPYSSRCSFFLCFV